jgi:putative transposase
MDGRGRALDNVFVERLWRSVKYEEVYLHDYQSIAEQGIGRYFEFYNQQRLHQSLGYRTPYEVHFIAIKVGLRKLVLSQPFQQWMG